MARATLATITPAAEASLIAAAQAGDTSASAELFTMYTPALNAAASRFAARLGQDDARQAAALGLLAAIAAFDPTRMRGETRLAVVLSAHVNEELWAAVAAAGLIAIPTRSMRRYFRVMREANGDLTLARDLAPRFDMSADTFMAVATAVQPGLTWDAEVLDRVAPSKYACVEDQILSAAALAACSELERAVLRLHYGVGSEDLPMPLPEVAAQLSMPLPKTRRYHATGLAACRAALGLM